jgi:hypothetical protein
MSVWNRDSHVLDSFPGASRSPLQGRFILEGDLHNLWFDDMLFYFSGGIWVRKGFTMNDWEGDFNIFFTSENGGRHHPIFHDVEQSSLSDVPDGALFGDSPDFVRNHTWFPIRKTLFEIHPDYVRKLASGGDQLVVQTFALEQHFDEGWFRQPTWKTVSKHVLVVSDYQKSDNQLIIKSG